MSSQVVNSYIVATPDPVWNTTAGSLSGGVYHPSGKGDKTDGWNTTGIGIVGGGNRPELDVWNGTTWADSGNDINITITGGSGCGTSTSIIVAGGDYQSDVSGAGNACSSYASGTWTQKSNMTMGKSRPAAIGTPSNYLSCGGQFNAAGSWARTGDVQEYTLGTDTWSAGVAMPTDATADGIMGCAGDGDSTSNGMVAGGWSTDYTITASAYAFNGSSWTATTIPDVDWANASGIGGGTPSGFWVMGGQLVGGWGTGIGAVAYYDGSSWSTKPNCLLEEAGAGGANNGGTNPLIAGGNIVGGSGNGSWTSGQYWG